MSRSARSLIGVAILGLMIAGGFFLWPTEPELISEGTSPDRTWAVAVYRYRSGDISVHVKNGQGETVRAFVIGNTSSDNAKSKFVVHDVDNSRAKVGNQIIEKAKYFPE